MAEPSAEKKSAQFDSYLNSYKNKMSSPLFLCIRWREDGSKSDGRVAGYYGLPVKMHGIAKFEKLLSDFLKECFIEIHFKASIQIKAVSL